MELDRTERRVLGTLIEKRCQTPDQYPLRLGALVAGCNQRSNRDPVIELATFEVEGAIMALRGRSLLKVVDVAGSRVERYGERLSDELSLSREEAAIVAELMLRGPQSSGELLRRCRRMGHYDHVGHVESLLRGMAERRMVHLLPRASGQRHARWEHRFTPASELAGDSAETLDDDTHDTAHTAPTALVDDGTGPVMGRATLTPTQPAPAGEPIASDELTELREEVATLREALAALTERVQLLEDLV